MEYTIEKARRRKLLLDRIATTEIEHFTVATSLKIVRAHPDDVNGRDEQLRSLEEQRFSLETGLEVLRAELAQYPAPEETADGDPGHNGHRSTALTP